MQCEGRLQDGPSRPALPAPTANGGRSLASCEASRSRNTCPAAPRTIDQGLAGDARMTEILDQTDLNRSRRPARRGGPQGGRRRGRYGVRAGFRSASKSASARSRRPGGRGRRLHRSGLRRKRSATVSANVLTESGRARRTRRRHGQGGARGSLLPASPTATVTRASDFDILDAAIPSAAELPGCVWKSRMPPGPSRRQQSAAPLTAGRWWPVLATSHGFAGSYLTSRFGIPPPRFAAGNRHGARLRWPRPRSPSELSAPARSPQGRRTAVYAGSTTEVPTGRATIVYDPRVSPPHRQPRPGDPTGPPIARQVQFPQEQLGERIFPETIQIDDDPTRPRAFLGSIRRRGVATRPLKIVEKPASCRPGSSIRRTAGARLAPMARRPRRRQSVAGLDQLTLRPGPQSRRPDRVDRYGIYVTRADRSRRQLLTGDYSRGAAAS